MSAGDHARWKRLLRVPHFIYALLDPRDMHVRYIGCCANMQERYSRHIAAPLPCIRSWIQELAHAGLKPHCLTLATTSGWFAGRAIERIYIYEYDLNTPGGILNKSNPIKSREEYHVYRWGQQWRMRMMRRAYVEVKPTLPKRPRKPRERSTYRSGPMPHWFGRQIEFNGKRQNIAAWARELGFSRQAIHQRLARLPLKEALKPKRKKKESATLVA